MSYHNHDPEERLPRKEADKRIIESIERDVEKAKEKRNEEIRQDIEMLNRLEEFDLTEKDVRWIRHLVGLPDGRGIPLLINWIQGRTGSAILHYVNKHVEKLPVAKFNERT